MIKLILIFLLSISLLGHYAASKEIEGITTPIEEGRDWRHQERGAWDVQSRELDVEPLKAWVKANPNGFFAAVLGNTRANRPNEYATVRQRHSYYDYISFYLEHGEHELPKLRPIRFFHATTSVTIQAELGMADSIGVPLLENVAPTLAKRWGVTKESIGTLVEINVRLFARNMDVIRRLLSEWKEPRDPRAIKPRNTLDPLAFDLAMVEFEQSEVESYLDERSVSSARITDITKMIRRGPVIPRLGTVAQVSPWVVKAGFAAPDFGNKGWRIAMGRALVFKFHRKSEEEYLSYMKVHPVRNAPRVSLYDGLQAPSEMSREALGHFTVVGSWRTEAGAMRHLADLRSRNRGIHAAVFPPYGRSRYWMVAVASFAPADAALELASQARRAGLARDAYVLRLRPVDPAGRAFSVAPRSVEVSVPARLMEAAPTIYDAERANFLSVFRSTDLAEAQAFQKAWVTRFPEIEFAVYQLRSESSYDVVLAAFANRNQVEAAREVARQIGLPETGIQMLQTRAEDVVARMDDRGRIATAAWEVVTSCYKEGRVTAAALHACSGLWMTPKTLTRCFLENDCRGLGDDFLTTPEEIAAFLEANGIVGGPDGEIKIDAAGLPIPTEAKALYDGIQACRGSAAGQGAAFVDCMATRLGQAANAQALSCLRDGVPSEAAVSCLQDAGAIPDLGDRAACFRGDVQDERSVALCLAGPEKAAAIDTAETCLGVARGEGEALSNCLGGFVPEGERELVSCLSDNRSSPERAALCALDGNPDARKAVTAFRCVQRRSDSNEEAAACLAELAGGDAGKVTRCVSRGGDEAAVAACMLEGNKEMQAAQQIYACATGGTSAAELVANCNGGLLTGDAQEVAACVAEQGASKEQVAACAATALLPEEWAPVAACAMKSQNGVGVALCVAAPGMNQEWRIAAECAASTGGEPFSFAGCTAGRLTLKELTQCLSGEIGKDCFGEGNTIVQAFKTVGNDLTNCVSGGPCLGKNNDIVQAAKGLEKAVSDVGKGIEKIGQDLIGEDSDFCRGDLTGWACKL
jgi:hypothetical protein